MRRTCNPEKPVRISPRTPLSTRQACSPTRQRQRAQTACSVGSNPTEPTNAPVVQPEEATASKAVQCWFESSRARHAPVADGEASGFQTRHWVFESPPGCHAPQQQGVSGRAANSVCAVQIRGGAPSSRAKEWTSCESHAPLMSRSLNEEPDR